MMEKTFFVNSSEELANVPKDCTELMFQSSFNKPLKKGDIPENVKYLCFGTYFNQPLKEGDMTRRQPDNNKMREILGRELISLEEGIKRMIASEKYLKSIGLEAIKIK